MKKTTLSLFLCVCTGLINLQAGDISREQATITARNFLYERINQNQATGFEELLVKEVVAVSSEGVNTYYIINFTSDGYVLVAADDQLIPVLGYSFEGQFSLENSPVQVKEWMEQYEKEILYHKKNNTRATTEIMASWQHLLTADPAQLEVFTGKNVSPFLPCNWDQGKYYNEYCPASTGGDGGHVWVGCVATAMAQVMYYFRFPLQGYGNHTYTHPVYGDLSANFAATTYQWDGMLNQLSTNNLPVALLSYHCGVSINMDYSPDGSGAQTSSVAEAMKSYFRYAASTQYVQRMSYSVQGWLDLITNEIDHKRPVLYSGYPSSGGAGHCWVADGYQGSDYYHMNWGWSGASNGYYTINNLNPSAGGTNFNNGHGMVVGIYPGSNYPSYCNGQKTITQHTTGTIEDGSGAENYQDNTSCSWLIAPDDSVTSIKLTFHRFDTEAGNDMVKVYGGPSVTSPLLGSFSGSSVPSPITFNGSKILITFETDGDTTAGGWYLTYTSTYPVYCSNKSFTTPSGTITDGSGDKNYQANTICTWTINPSNVASVVLEFTSFNTEPVHDVIKIYDLNTEELLATYSGNAIPPPVMTNTGGMFIQFRTNGSNNYPGWEANYHSLGTGMEETGSLQGFTYYPNPARDQLTVKFHTTKPQAVEVSIMTLDGKTILEDKQDLCNSDFSATYATSPMAKGVYMLRILAADQVINKKLVIQ